MSARTLLIVVLCDTVVLSHSWPLPTRRMDDRWRNGQIHGQIPAGATLAHVPVQPMPCRSKQLKHPEDEWDPTRLYVFCDQMRRRTLTICHDRVLWMSGYRPRQLTSSSCTYYLITGGTMRTLDRPPLRKLQPSGILT